MSRIKQKVTILLIVLAVVSALGFTLFMNNGMKFLYKSKASEAEGGPRWTPSAYEQYKLDTNAVSAVLQKEQKYVQKIKSRDKLIQAKSEGLTREKLTPEIKAALKEFGMKEENIVTPEQSGATEDKSKTSPNVQGESVLGATSELAIPQIGTRDVPSVAGGDVNKFTGTVSHSYNIGIPAIRGNAGVSVRLSYSSRTIDDLRTNKMGYENAHRDFWDLEEERKSCGDYRCEYWDRGIEAHTDSATGLGWSLSSFGSITIDSDYENEYVLSVGGQNVRIKQEGGKFFTYPDNKFLIERYDKWGAWKVTDTSGNVYVFGSLDYANWNNSGLIPRNSANEHVVWGGYGTDEHHTPYCTNSTVARWNLSKISDIHGNTVEVEYRQKIDEVLGCGQSMFSTPIEVKYNYSEEKGKYMNKVVLEYFDYDTQALWDKNSNPPVGLMLGKVLVYSGDFIVNSYNFGYTKSFMNSTWVGGETRRLLLTSITKKGFDGKGEQRPTTFCYKSLKDGNNPEVCNGTDTTQLDKTNYTPNDIYLTSFDNGYGGKVTYHYEKVANIDNLHSKLKCNTRLF